VLFIGTSIASQPVCVSAASAMLLNRRLVLKQLSTGQFALTVQPMPGDVLGGPFMMTSAQTAETSPACCVTVDSSCDPVVPEAHVRLISCGFFTFVESVIKELRSVCTVTCVSVNESLTQLCQLRLNNNHAIRECFSNLKFFYHILYTFGK